MLAGPGIVSFTGSGAPLGQSPPGAPLGTRGSVSSARTQGCQGEAQLVSDASSQGHALASAKPHGELPGKRQLG